MVDKREVFLDIETTGLDPNNGHVILSIGVIVENTKTLAKRAKAAYSEFYVEILPTSVEWSAADPRALQTNGFTYEHLQKNGVSFGDAVASLAEFLVEHQATGTKVEVIGQKPGFDMGFLRRYMGDAMSFIGFPTTDPIDTIDLYGILENRDMVEILRSHSLRNLAIALGIVPEPNPHNALMGARTAKAVYERTIELGARS